MKKLWLVLSIVGVAIIVGALGFWLSRRAQTGTIVSSGATTSSNASQTNPVTTQSSDMLIKQNYVQPDAVTIQKLSPGLGMDQMVVCDPFGMCQVKTIPFSAEEQAVLSGSKEVSARAVYNADDPTGPVRFLEKIYGRVILKPTPAVERWYRTIDLGVSWQGPSEVTVTQGDQTCNSVKVSAGMPWQIFATLDNSTCDASTDPIVIRWAALLAENDQQVCSGPTPSGCKPFAPITVLGYKRKGYQVFYGDELKNAYQARVTLGEPLP